MKKSIRDRHYKMGFTLVEIMIVVAIIALLSAVAIPNLLRARASANETTAQASLRTIHTSAESYKSVNNDYPTNLAALSAAIPPYIDSILGTGSKQGYDFVLTGSSDVFTATAQPETYGRTGERSFFVDENGVIRYTSADRSATSVDFPITP